MRLCRLSKRRNSSASDGFIFTHVGQVENGAPYGLAPNKGKKNWIYAKKNPEKNPEKKKIWTHQSHRNIAEVKAISQYTLLRR